LATGSMTMVLPSQRSRTRVPRARRQLPTRRTARLLPTLKTTVSLLTRTGYPLRISYPVWNTNPLLR